MDVRFTFRVELIMLRTAIRFVIVSTTFLLFVLPARAADEKRLQIAIDRAVAYLMANYKFDRDGVAWQPSKRGVKDQGIALCGIALLQAKVPANDPVNVDIARLVREASIDEDRTTLLAWDIIFLDKLGQDVDTPLIQSMAVRLIMGQDKAGGWSDTVPAFDLAGRKRMIDLLNLNSTKVLADSNRPDRLRLPRLDPFMREILEGKHIAQIPDSSLFDDNSNTLFATLAVWAARKYGVPATALENTQRRFRLSQFPDGGWAREGVGPRTPNPTMTCAGIVGLALADGFQRELVMRSRDPNIPLKESTKETRRPPPSPRNDRQVLAAFSFLVWVIKGDRLSEMQDNLYFLWSLESACLALNMKTVGDRKWFDWGADWLISHQNPDGSFTGKWGKRADTSLALMYLLQSNILKDLTHILKSGEGVFKPSEKEATSEPKEKPPVSAPAPEVNATPVHCQPQYQPCPCDCCQPMRRPGICGFLFHRRR
jgi:hypothetical protein